MPVDPTRQPPRSSPLRLPARVGAWFSQWRARPAAPPADSPTLPPPASRRTEPGVPRRNDVQRISSMVARLQLPLDERNAPAHEDEPQPHRDAQTGLWNRAYLASLSEQLAQEPPNATLEFCVLRLDLEDLKVIHDRHGAGAGAQVLVQVAARLRQCVRAQDFVLRLGSEEFMLLLPCPAGEGDALARKVGARIVQDLHRPLSYLTLSSLRIGCSVGAALWPRDGAALTDAMEHATEALDAAKRAGRGQIRHYAAAANSASDATNAG